MSPQEFCTPGLHLPTSSIFFFFTLGFHNIFHLYCSSLLTSFSSSISLSSNPFITLQLIHSFPYLKPVNGSPTCRIQGCSWFGPHLFLQIHLPPLPTSYIMFQQNWITYSSQNTTRSFNNPVHLSRLLRLHYPTSKPINPSSVSYFSITTVKTFIQPTFTEYFYVPQRVLGTGDPAVNYSPYPDGIYNLMRTKDTKQLIINVVKDYKGSNTVYNGNVY